MTQDRFLPKLGAAFVALFAAFCLWQTPGMVTGKLSEDEVNQALAYVDKNLPLDGDKADVLRRLRSWALADDGQPVYMLNLMRYNASNQPIPGVPAVPGTPKEANKHYEDAAMPLLLKKGGAGSSYAGDVQGSNILTIGADPALDNWSRVLVIRYPSRRHFLNLLTDPAYLPIEPYKMASLKLLLVPTSSDMIIPDYRLIVGAALLVIFLGIGWRRAVRTGQKTSR